VQKWQSLRPRFIIQKFGCDIGWWRTGNLISEDQWRARGDALHAAFEIKANNVVLGSQYDLTDGAGKNDGSKGCDSDAARDILKI